MLQVDLLIVLQMGRAREGVEPTKEVVMVNDKRGKRLMTREVGGNKGVDKEWSGKDRDGEKKNVGEGNEGK